ncbi:MAG: hypothetical protein LBQ89_03665 [Treponema sp.]|jgi:hypothetical protein|nr:hypothetical protein [Treponema sp.]
MAKITPKTKPVKKPAPKAKPAASKKKNPVKSAERDNLAKELKSLIPKLDEEGLAFLVKQAQVHLYNMQVDALNKTIVKDEERKKTSPVKRKIKGGGFNEIKMSESGSSYYIVYGNESMIFNNDEMTTLVKIAFSEGTELEVRERLYNWLSAERGDLLYTASIGSKFDDKLKELVFLLKDNFKLKK